MLSWRSLPYEPGKALVKGTRLGVAIVGPLSRFAIYEVRTRELDGFAGVRYIVCDATLVSDAELKAGKVSPQVFAADNCEECEEYCRNIANNA
jgi:hypothetical protein